MPGKKKIKQQSNEISPETGVKFLLEEFNALRSFKEQSVTIADKRVDSQLALTSAFIAGFGLLSQTKIDAQNLLIIAIAGVLALLLIGLITFKQVVDRDILIVDYVRAINRIRAYFAESVPDIKPYLLMPVSHEFPAYQWQSSNRRIPMIINAVAVGTVVILLNMLLSGKAITDWVALCFGVSSFLVTYFFEVSYAARVFQVAEEKARSSRTVSLFESHRRLRESMRK